MALFPMKTVNRIHFSDARRMESVETESVDLVVTSPPYPMIQMWDDIFSAQNGAIRDALTLSSGPVAFELMHATLDGVWREAERVLRNGGFICINIGDAVRTLNGEFRLYANHSRILETLQKIGFTLLPDVLWRKQTNAPNKFMGSGMLPAGAYVTLEHEYILIARKGPKRKFQNEEERRNRRASALFWEERNTWFSDIWFDIKGVSQKLGSRETRARSAAFPFELAYRLVNMYSVKGDTVLDPFVGTGTTLAAAMVSGRNGIGFEIDITLTDPIRFTAEHIVDYANNTIQQRLQQHRDFVNTWMRENGPMKHTNPHYGFPVMTAQEKELVLDNLIQVRSTDENCYEVLYEE